MPVQSEEEQSRPPVSASFANTPTEQLPYRNMSPTSFGRGAAIRLEGLAEAPESTRRKRPFFDSGPGWIVRGTPVRSP